MLPHHSVRNSITLSAVNVVERVMRNDGRGWGWVGVGVGECHRYAHGKGAMIKLTLTDELQLYVRDCFVPLIQYAK